MAKSTKANVAKPAKAKVVTPAVAREKKADAKPVARKEKEVKKVVTKKPVVVKKEPAKVAQKPATKKVVVPKAPQKPAAKKEVIAKPVVKNTSVPKATAKTTAKKVEPVKPVHKAPALKKEQTVTPKAKPLMKTDLYEETGEVTIEKKLIALYSLQQIDSQVDKIRIIRGELPLEVQDLEDEIAGLETRIENYLVENAALEKSVSEKKISIKDSQAMIKKYEEQQMNVRNNREYDSLTKEIEIQSLEIQLAEKRIREFQQALEVKGEEIERFQKILADRKNDLEIKKNELDDIVAETEKEENELTRASEINHKFIEDRLITAYTRIRKNARNGLAVVQIERDACGGCFNKIPPQHQLDIRMHKKIIVCEYCGRILVDDGIVNAVH
jgi:uncharacterized protein